MNTGAIRIWTLVFVLLALVLASCGLDSGGSAAGTEPNLQEGANSQVEIDALGASTIAQSTMLGTSTQPCGEGTLQERLDDVRARVRGVDERGEEFVSFNPLASAPAELAICTLGELASVVSLASPGSASGKVTTDARGVANILVVASTLGEVLTGAVDDRVALQDGATRSDNVMEQPGSSRPVWVFVTEGNWIRHKQMIVTKETEGGVPFRYLYITLDAGTGLVLHRMMGDELYSGFLGLEPRTVQLLIPADSPIEGGAGR